MTQTNLKEGLIGKLEADAGRVGKADAFAVGGRKMSLVADEDLLALPQERGAPAKPIWKRDVYDSLASAVGAAPVAGIARRFSADLNTRFSDHIDRDRLQREAHAVVSAAGMLGFTALAVAARALEQACLVDTDIALPLAILLMEKRATEQCLAGLLSSEPPDASPATA